MTVKLQDDLHKKIQHKRPCTKTESDLTSGSIAAGAWRLAWPMFINMGILAASNCVEGWVAGRLGSDVQAGAGIGGQIWYFNIMLTLALAAGTTALVSNHWGARNLAAAIQTARQAILCSIIFGAGAAIFTLAAGPALVHLFGASAAVETQIWEYLKFTAISMLPSSVLWISNAVFRAKGDAVSPMNTMILVTALIIVLDVFLCLHTDLKITGIGISAIIACCLGVAINAWRFQNSELRDCLRLDIAVKELFSCGIVQQFLSIGLPACVQDLSLIGGSFGIFFILGRTAESLSNQAAWAAGWRAEEVLTIMPMYALNIAAATMTGQNLGAGKPQRAYIAGWQIAGAAAAVSTITGLVLFFAGDKIAQLLCADPSTVAACTNYLHTMAAAQPFLAFWLVLSGALQGAAYTRRPMLHTVISFNIIRLGLAGVLGWWGGSITGVWLAMLVSAVVAGILLLREWQQKNWQLQGSRPAAFSTDQVESARP